MIEAVSDCPPDLATVAWTWSLGRAGPYERAVDDGSVAFQTLLARIRRAGGSIDSDGYHVWLFPNGRTIGRRAKRHE